MDRLDLHIEALVFASEQALKPAEIKATLEESLGNKINKSAIDDALARLIVKYETDQTALEFTEIAGGFQFLTKAPFHNTIGTYLRQITRKRLSKAALECLAIIAYRQPVPKSEIEKIRGVNCDYSIQKLLEKELIVISGRSEGPGRPLLYGTSEKFMEHFGLKDISDLPKPKEFQVAENEIGQPAPIEVEIAPEANREAEA